MLMNELHFYQIYIFSKMYFFAQMSINRMLTMWVLCDLQKDPVTNICQAADKQLFTLVEWAKRIPHFPELPLEDQVILLRAGQ